MEEHEPARESLDALGEIDRAEDRPEKTKNGPVAVRRQKRNDP